MKLWHSGVYAYINWWSVTWSMLVYEDNIVRDFTETGCECGLVETWSVWDLIVGFYGQLHAPSYWIIRRYGGDPSNCSPLKKKDVVLSYLYTVDIRDVPKETAKLEVYCVWCCEQTWDHSIALDLKHENIFRRVISAVCLLLEAVQEDQNLIHSEALSSSDSFPFRDMCTKCHLRLPERIFFTTRRQQNH